VLKNPKFWDLNKAHVYVYVFLYHVSRAHTHTRVPKTHGVLDLNARPGSVLHSLAGVAKHTLQRNDTLPSHGRVAVTSGQREAQQPVRLALLAKASLLPSRCCVVTQTWAQKPGHGVALRVRAVLYCRLCIPAGHANQHTVQYLQQGNKSRAFLGIKSFLYSNIDKNKN